MSRRPSKDNGSARRDREGDYQTPRGEGRGLGRAQLISLVVAAVVTLAGGALWAVGAASSAVEGPAAVERRSSPEAGREAPLLAPEQGLVPVDPPAGPSAAPPAAEEAPPAEEGLMDRISPAVFRLGFSFLVGFAIAYALRTFVRISLVAAGLLVLALFGLQYFGVIDVNWTAMEGHFDRARDWLAANTRTFGDFVTGQLPSAGSAVAGFVVGVRKRI